MSEIVSNQTMSFLVSNFKYPPVALYIYFPLNSIENGYSVHAFSVHLISENYTFLYEVLNFPLQSLHPSKYLNDSEA